MLFRVVSSAWSLGLTPNQAYLVVDNWDDWFTFRTMYSLIVVDSRGARVDVGSVKIGQRGLQSGRPDLPETFTQLSEGFFSVGQDDSYYSTLNDLQPADRVAVLAALRDVAFDTSILDDVLDETVLSESLLRSVRISTIRGQFARMAHGGARLSPFAFSYALPRSSNSPAPPVVLSFAVEPESLPPSNIHVLIGRNGVGKTHLLTNMTHCLLSPDGESKGFGKLSNTEPGAGSFAGVVSVSFSAFDTFQQPPDQVRSSSAVQFSYVGLKHPSPEAASASPKTPHELAKEFAESVAVCRSGARLPRWKRALDLLSTDPIFRDANLDRLTTQESARESTNLPTRLFERLSSGHKIVLLTMTRLVETIEERTLVLIDEPEAHLHPPLLSAFIRSLSDLLVNRNGAALVATHSPVVLQEVPSDCVWKVRRSGLYVVAERPEIETFGENVGVLTREVFGLEVTDAGFHQLLRQALASSESFAAAVAKFEGKLGGEARALLHALLSNQPRDQS